MSNQPINSNITKVGIVATIFIVVATLVTATLHLPPQTRPTSGQFNSTIYPASLSAIAASCGDIFRFKTTPNLYGVIPDKIAEQNKEALIPVAPMIVPVYGYMSKEALPDSAIKFYDEANYEPISRATLLRTMYDKDTTVIYYTKALDSGNLFAVKQYADNHPNVLAIPWTFDSAGLPLNRDLAWSKWGISQSCIDWNGKALNDFLELAKEKPVTHAKKASEVELTVKGALPSIVPGRFTNGPNS